MSVYEEIKQERARQDKEWGGPRHDDTHSEFHWRDFIQEHVQRSRSLGAYRRQMIRVAALAVAAIESYDRRADSAAKGQG